MIGFKVADAQISAEARKTAGEERSRGGRGAGISAAAESCHAALRTVCPWSFRGDTGTARRAPPPALEG